MALFSSLLSWRQLFKGERVLGGLLRALDLSSEIRILRRPALLVPDGSFIACIVARVVVLHLQVIHFLQVFDFGIIVLRLIIQRF